MSRARALSPRDGAYRRQAGGLYGLQRPGATNLVTAIADARLDSIPLVCITGQVPASMIGTDAFQEVDTYGISIPITKHNYLVRDIAELPQVISDAFRIAQSGRPGPVWIDIPKDVQSATIELEALPEPGERAPAPAFAPESVREAAAMINAAKRPVLYLGGGVINAPQAIRELAESQPADHHDLNGAGHAAEGAPAVAGDAGDARRAQHQLYSAGGGFTDCFRRPF